MSSAKGTTTTPRVAASSRQRQRGQHEAVASQGVLFSVDHAGYRSSVRAGRIILAAAMRPLNPEAAQAALTQGEWRQDYAAHFLALLREQVQQPAAALLSCQEGLAAASAELPFAEQAVNLPLSQAVQQALAQPPTLGTAVLQGQGNEAVVPWQVPYRGQLLQGSALARQIDHWEAAGIAEPTCAEALRACLKHPEWFDLSDRHLLLLGAGSEAGPLRWLAQWRAQMVAVDLPRPALWKRMAALVRAGNGRLLAPVMPRAGVAAPGGAGAVSIEQAGADLLLHAPALAAWAVHLGLPLDVAHLAYADGERHLRLAHAMDGIGQALCQAERRTTLAFLATPTDAFAVPEPLAAAVQQLYAERGVLKRATQATVRTASRGRSFLPHVTELLATGLQEPAAADWARAGVVDAIVTEQGPNYLLAKRLQQWRALVARAAGHVVSLNVAPSTRTASVVSNKLLAAGFRGAKSFGCEVFEPETTNALMAALWVHDLRNPQSKAQPAVALPHPLAFISDQANHGGLWRVPYLPRSVLPLAAMLGLVKPAK
jgi:hypothetical protein